VIGGTLERVHADVLRRGYALAAGAALGWPREADVIAALSPALEPDPRGPGKLHARDVIDYDRAGASYLAAESGSIAHGNVDDFSRLWLLEQSAFRGPDLAAHVLALAPPSLRRPAGRMSADYFRYGPGTGSPAHRDEFGDLVVIWVLGRSGAGAESFLTDLHGRDVLRGPLDAGSVLVFRDEMFLHGVTELKDGHRDALIFITLKDET
jgi:hypothetical protein